MIDSHCHLNDSRFDADRQVVLANMVEHGLTHAVVVGYDASSSHQSVAIGSDQASHPEGLSLFSTVGVAPHDADTWSDDVAQQLDRLAGTPGVVGWGEIGLDYYYPTPSREVQIQALRDQLVIARDRGLPVVFHLREASEDLFRTMDEVGFKGPGVLHCFTGDLETMQAGVERGLFVSYSGILTFKNSDDLRFVARRTPTDRVLVETDAPYLAPVPYRGHRCEPWQVTATAAVLAEIKGISVASLEKILIHNLKELFHVIP